MLDCGYRKLKAARDGERMTKKIRREIAFLKTQDAIMNQALWDKLVYVLDAIADRIDQLEDERNTE